jgi:hypothetical protein
VGQNEIMEEPLSMHAATASMTTWSWNQRQRQAELDLIAAQIRCEVQRKMRIVEERFARMSKLVLRTARKRAMVLLYMRLPLHGNRPSDKRRSDSDDNVAAHDHSSEGGEAAQRKGWRRTQRLKLSASALKLIGDWPQNLRMDDVDECLEVQQQTVNIGGSWKQKSGSWKEKWKQKSGSWKEKFTSQVSAILSILKARTFDGPTSRSSPGKQQSFSATSRRRSSSNLSMSSAFSADSDTRVGFPSREIYPVPFNVGEFGRCCENRGARKVSRTSIFLQGEKEKKVAQEIAAMRSRSGLEKRPIGLIVVDIDPTVVRFE